MKSFLPPFLMALALPALCSDYAAALQHSEQLRALTDNKVVHNRVEAHWLPGNTQFWFISKTGPDTQEYVLVDSSTASRQVAFDHAQLAAALQKAGLTNQRAEKLSISISAWRPAGKNFDFRCGGKSFQCALDTYALKEIPASLENAPLVAPASVPRASVGGGDGTVLTFVNSSHTEVQLFWLDTDGKRWDYGKLKPGAEHEQSTYAGHVWLAVGPQNKTLGAFLARNAPGRAEISDSPAPAAARAEAPAPRAPREFAPPSPASPDGHWLTFVRERNLVLRNKETRQEHALTTDGSANDAYSDHVYWSPDSTHFVAVRTIKGDERKVTLVESSPKEQLQPRIKLLDYLKAGDRVPQDTPCLFELDGKDSARHIPIDGKLFEKQWSMSEWRWAPDSSAFTFLFNQRGHQALRVISIDAASGAARVLINEERNTFIDYSGKFFARYLDASKEIIWMSERDGWNHVYLLDAVSGAVKSQLTKGAWAVRGVDKVDPEKRQLWFHAGGIHAGQDPYFVHFARVNFDGSGLTLLTDGNGTHNLDYAPGGELFIDTYSRVDLPPVSELRRTSDGKLVCEIERADYSALLKTGWQPPESFVAKGRDNESDIYGVLVRPTKFDAQKKYPVIELIYAGPQAAFVPKQFRAYSQMQELAELGFIVVQIDGMGTNYRSKKFHDVCWKNLGDSGFPDRILWIKAAAQKYPALDLSRVGIYGGSAGGQSALRALLAHGDFYKAAVADSGCHDNRMDKIWWNEQWMGWPVGPHYADQSNVTQAHKLQGKLLLLAGELDTNVDPSSTMQVANALIKAGKDFEMLMVPGAGHGVLGLPYCWKRLEKFFYKNLIEAESK